MHNTASMQEIYSWLWSTPKADSNLTLSYNSTVPVEGSEVMVLCDGLISGYSILPREWKLESPPYW